MKYFGNIHVVVGMTGTGKTYFCKNLIKNCDINKMLIYDTNKEYLQEKELPLFYDFLQRMIRANKKIIIIEDATIFLKKRGYSEEIEQCMVSRRHKENYIILIFHSLNKIPSYILELTNIMTIFKTEDKTENVLKLDNKLIYDTFVKVYQNNNSHYSETIILKD